MEIAQVRKQVSDAIQAAKRTAAARRQLAHEAQDAYEHFLADVATPLVRQVANVLKAEGYAFLVHTPSGGLRLVSERSRDDHIEFALDTEASPPQVVALISRARGGRVVTDERAVKPGSAPSEISEQDLLAFVVDVLTPWVER